MSGSEFSENIINNSPNIITAIDTDLRYTIFNPAAEKYTGLKKEVVIGKRVTEVFPNLKNTKIEQSYIDALHGKTTNVERFNYTIPQTGKEGLVRGTYSPIFENDGKISGGLGIIEDITEQARMQQALKES